MLKKQEYELQKDKNDHGSCGSWCVRVKSFWKRLCPATPQQQGTDILNRVDSVADKHEEKSGLEGTAEDHIENVALVCAAANGSYMIFIDERKQAMCIRMSFRSNFISRVNTYSSLSHPHHYNEVEHPRFDSNLTSSSSSILKTTFDDHLQNSSKDSPSSLSSTAYNSQVLPNDSTRILMAPSSSTDGSIGDNYPTQLKVFAIDDSELICKGYERLLLPQLQADMANSEVCCPKTLTDVRRFIDNVIHGTISTLDPVLSNFDTVDMFGVDGIDMVDEASCLSSLQNVYGGENQQEVTYEQSMEQSGVDFCFFDDLVTETMRPFQLFSSSGDLCILDQNIDIKAHGDVITECLCFLYPAVLSACISPQL